MKGFNSSATETYGINMVQTSIQDEIEAFDRLPKWIREEINYAPYKVSSIELQKRIDEGQRYVPSDFPKFWATANKMNAKAAYGPDHPQAQ